MKTDAPESALMLETASNVYGGNVIPNKRVFNLSGKLGVVSGGDTATCLIHVFGDAVCKEHNLQLIMLT